MAAQNPIPKTRIMSDADTILHMKGPRSENMYIKQAKTRRPVGSTVRWEMMKFKVIPVGTRAFGKFVCSDGRLIDCNR